MNEKKKTVAILCAGGPAPGVNAVIATITKRFLAMGFRVIGLHYGFKTLFTNQPMFLDLTYTIADRIIDRGGSILVMDRYKPKDGEFTSNFFADQNVVLLVTIGGDDTASSANRLCQFLNKYNVSMQNIHVPKTIDNDLPLPHNISTFGFESAKHHGSRAALVYMEEAATSRQWLIVSAMGREAGHLALGIGSACHYPVIVIPEMFGKTITFKQVTKLIISSMIKRLLMVQADYTVLNFGAAIISEGIFHKISDDEIKATGICLTYDAHGHPELGLVGKAYLITSLLYQELKSIDLAVKLRAVEIGYDIRCVNPSGFDLEYCNSLGLCVEALFKRGETQCIALVAPNREYRALKMSDISDSEGVIIPRLVDVNTQENQSILASMELLGPEDVQAAKGWVKNPEDYIIINRTNL